MDIPKTVVRRDGDQITVVLPDRTIVPARDVEHAKAIIGGWLGTPLHRDASGQLHGGLFENGRLRTTITEWIGFDGDEAAR